MQLMMPQGHTFEQPAERNVHLIGDVCPLTIAQVIQSILDINESDVRISKTCEATGFAYTPRPISLFIDSYGGDVYPALGLASVIESSKTPVHTIVTGSAMSAAFLILLSGHKRFAYRYSSLMLHEIRSCIEGTLKEIQENAEEMNRLQSIFETIVFQRSKITREKMRKVFKAKSDWYMSADEALTVAAIDEIL